MRRSTILPLVLSVVVAHTLVAAPARAQNSEQAAEKLFNEAISLVTSGNYAAACPKFAESQRLDPALGTQFNLADCYEHTGKKGTARRLFTEVADAAKAAGKSEREKTSRERANALDASAPRLTINVPASGAAIHLEILVDGVASPAVRWNREQFLDSGSHTVAASAAGKKPFDTKVVLEDGKSVSVTIPELENEPVALVTPLTDDRSLEAGNGQRRVGLIVGAVGVLGLAVGAGAGIFSAIKHGQAKDLCPNFSSCPNADGRSNWNAATDAGTVSTISFIAGGFGVAAGAVLYFTATRKDPASTNSAGWWLMPSVGAGSAGLVAVGRL